jgi:hypothetical protein
MTEPTAQWSSQRRGRGEVALRGGANVEPVGAEALLAPGLGGPYAAFTSHASERFGMEPETLGSLAGVEHPFGLVVEVRPQPRGEFAQRVVIERGEYCRGEFLRDGSLLRSDRGATSDWI